MLISHLRILALQSDSPTSTTVDSNKSANSKSLGELLGIEMDEDIAEDKAVAELRLFDANIATLTSERLDLTHRDQLQKAIFRVQRSLHEAQPRKALAIARQLWRLWPEVSPASADADIMDNPQVDFVAISETEMDQSNLANSNALQIAQQTRIKAMESGLAPVNRTALMSLWSIHMSDLRGLFFLISV
ncbi:unnamed protein product [Protopolystoma xenopodis]|uniref:Uncharacterized protein n=1 Tax=Protopolystoma xenopodis TaxID=117903 RepID=A0A3S5CI79_9PLAT|nr:unnamed protein product [Protopolystoma xenopodis]